MARPDLYYLDESEGELLHQALPARSVVRRIAVAALGLALASTVALGAATPSVAAPGTRVDVEPESLQVQVGQGHTLTAVLRDADGTPAIGPGTNAHVPYNSPDRSAQDQKTTNSAWTL